MRSPFSLWKKAILRAIALRPLGSFILALFLLLAAIAVGHKLRSPKTSDTQPTVEEKKVEVFTFGSSPTVTYSGKTQKAGVITIVAGAPGIVTHINSPLGSHVNRGTAILTLANTANGGNAAALNRQIAEKNYETATANFDVQLDTINKQKDLASKGETVGADVRAILRQSQDETRGLIALNQDIVNTLTAQINQLTSTNVNGINDAAILGAKQGKAAALSGLNQLQAGLRQSLYNGDDGLPPAQVAHTGKDVAVNQLELQARGVVLSRDVTELNLKLARLNEAAMAPASPVSGSIERIYVYPGQFVSPGTPLAVVKADRGQTEIIVGVPHDIARQVARTEDSTLVLGENTVSAPITYLSTEATDGPLYTITYHVPPSFTDAVTDGQLVSVRIPLATKQIVTGKLLVPLDSVYQTQEQSFVYVARRDGDKLTARSTPVSLGNVVGTYVEARSGILPNDTIIVSRSVQDGDVVTTR